jgi:hypothetical protein
MLYRELMYPVVGRPLLLAVFSNERGACYFVLAFFFSPPPHFARKCLVHVTGDMSTVLLVNNTHSLTHLLSVRKLCVFVHLIQSQA